MNDVGARAAAALLRDPTSAAVLIDVRGRPIWASPTMATFVGTTPGAADPLLDAVHPDDVERCVAIMSSEFVNPTAATIVTDRRFESIVRLRAPSGEYRPVSVHMVNLLDDPEVAGVLLQLTLSNQDVHAIRAFDAYARGSPISDVLNTMLGVLDLGTGNGSQVVLFDRDGVCLATGPGACIEVGNRREDPAWRAECAGGRLVSVLDVRSRAGTLLATLDTTAHTSELHPYDVNLHETTVARIAILLERDRADAALRRQASHDPMTQLLNRSAFYDALSTLPPEQSVSIAFVDINQFKTINDTHGHAAGDAVVVEAAKRLRHFAGDDDLLARHGGDEFVLVQRDPEPQANESLFESLVNALDGPFVLPHGRIVWIRCAIGVATGAAADSASLLVESDARMYVHKRLTVGERRHDALPDGDAAMRRMRPSSLRG